MTLKQVEEVIKEVYPKIEKFYGFSKFLPNETPYVETHYNIYARYSGEAEAEGEQDSCQAEYDRTDNSIVVYWPNMKNRKHIIQTLVHEYQHYLQSPSWFKRFYTMGYDYNDHPYEVAAYAEESNWKVFN